MCIHMYMNMWKSVLKQVGLHINLGKFLEAATQISSKTSTRIANVEKSLEAITHADQF